MPEAIPSLHVLGSKQFGGADQFYVRLVRALFEAGQPVTAVNRRISPVTKALDESGIPQIHLPMANGWDVWSLWQMKRLAGRLRPDIVQTYMGRATRLTRLTRLTRNGGPVHIARLGGYYKIDGYYRHAHAWIGNTRGLCDYLVANGLPAERVFQIGNFVPEPVPFAPAALTELRRNWNIPDGHWVLMSLGRLIDIKGFDDLLKALAQLPPEIAGRPWVMLLAGDGPLAQELRTLADQLGLSDRVRWLGWQNPADACYAVSDLFVCPSRREALGNVILEAWNCGLPVISTRTPGALELIEENHNGLLCDIGDAKALAGLIRELLSAPDERRSALGKSGQDFLNANFSRRAILEAYLSLYARLLAG